MYDFVGKDVQQIWVVQQTSDNTENVRIILKIIAS